MKKNLGSLLVLVLISAQSCVYTKSSDGVSGDNGFISNLVGTSGKGEIIEKKYAVDFDELQVSTSLKAEVYKSNKEEIIVSAPSDLMGFVEVKTSGNIVHIRINNNGMKSISTDRISIKVYAKDFNKLNANSSGDIILKDNFTVSDLDLQISSSGSIKAKIKGDKININSSSSGDFDGEIFADVLKIQASSSSGVNAAGSVKNVDISANSSADINLANLVADNANVNVSSSADVTVGVRTSVTASASSSGDISIIKKGELSHISKNESSSGSVTIR